MIAAEEDSGEEDEDDDDDAFDDIVIIPSIAFWTAHTAIVDGGTNTDRS